MHGKEHLLREVRELDADGWNRKDKGDIQDMTGERIYGLFYKILEEILEILLGNRDQFSEERMR